LHTYGNSVVSEQLEIMDNSTMRAAARRLLLETTFNEENRMMATLIRWTNGLVSRLDAMIVQIENHDAIADAAIQSVTHNVARARVQLGRVKHDGRTLADRLAREQESVGKWRERAAGEADDARAIECLRRAKRATALAAELARRSEDHQQTEKQLTLHLDRLEERLRAIREQRNVLRTRQSRADATHAVGRADSRLDGQIDDIFERWEMRVAESEIADGVELQGGDSFEEAFEAEDEKQALEAELAELRRNR
jgi:phage shock protein A